MGYELNRFITEVDQEFICPICAMVLENGVQSQHCEHTFCEICIKQWLSVNKSCPVDRKELKSKNLIKISRPFKNLLFKLELKCDFESEGCRIITKLNDLQNHINRCTFNPNVEVTCDKECGLKMKRKDYRDHNCVKLLAHLYSDQQNQMIDIKQEFRSLINAQNWQNGELTINQNNIIHYPKSLKKTSKTMLKVRASGDYGENDSSDDDNDNEEDVDVDDDEDDDMGETRIAIDISRSLYALSKINNYFEVQIIDLGNEAEIAVGLTPKDYPTDCFPGCKKGSIAFHGDDGRIYIGSNTGYKFGPKWKNGDIIGCGIKFEDNNDVTSKSVAVYFQRNNALIGERSMEIPDGGLYPTVGLSSIGARVRVNV